MYEYFQLKTAGKKTQKIWGYHWKKENPDYVVCIVHGIGESAAQYDRMAGYLTGANMAAVAMDLRGHGESFGKRGHCAPRKEIKKDIDDLLVYAHRQYPDTPLVLYGHSMGGNLVLDYRKQGKFNFLPAAYIVSAPWVLLTRKVPDALYYTVKALAKIAPQMTVSAGIPANYLGNEEIVGGRNEHPLIHNKISTACAVDGFTIGQAMAKGVHPDNGGAKGIPMLLMHGTEDKICDIKGSEQIAAIEDCDYIRWPGLYHEIHNGGGESTGEEVIERMIQWIRELSD